MICKCFQQVFAALHCGNNQLCVIGFACTHRHIRAGNNRFSGEQKSVLLQARLGDCCVPGNFLLLATL